jgi:hypothetical protein
MRNQLIIFSKNRACQLHLLLESIEKNSNNIFDAIFVIHTYTTKEYFDGYRKLTQRFPNVSFIVEDDFYKDTMSNIKPQFDYTTFMVDDIIFYKKLDYTQEEILSVFDDTEKPISCFSLRLGLNCNYSHPANLPYQIKEYEETPKFITVNVKEQTGDFAYPLSVDGHIFKTEFIIKYFQMLGGFNNPNILESKMQMLSSVIYDNMSFLKGSVIVGVPVNIVNNTHKNRQGLEFYFSENTLNIKYNNNEVVDTESMNFNGINGPHKEIEYKFKEYVTKLS